MSKIERTELSEHLGARVKVSGHYLKSDLFTDFSVKREYPTVCLQDVFIDDRQAGCTEHVWVHHAEAVKAEKPEYGELIAFTAVVKEYEKRIDGKPVKSYYLDRPQDITFPDRQLVSFRPMPPAAVEQIRDKANGLPRQPIGILPRMQPAVAAIATAAPAADGPPDYPALIREAKALARKCGGLGRLKELVELLLED